MLGQHAVGDEDAVRPETALGDDALPLAEQVGQDAGIGHLDRFLRVGHREGDRGALPAHDRALFDQTAEPDALAGLQRCRRAGRPACRNRKPSGRARRRSARSAAPRKASPPAMTDNRFCLRVMRLLRRRQAERWRQTRRISWPRRCRRRMTAMPRPSAVARLIGLAQHDIGTNEPHPAFRVVRILPQLFVEAGDHRVRSWPRDPVGDIDAAASIAPRRRDRLPARAGSDSPACPTSASACSTAPRHGESGGRPASMRLPGRDRFLVPPFLRQAPWPDRSWPSAWPGRASAPPRRPACASAETMPPAALAIASPSPAWRAALSPSRRMALR